METILRIQINAFCAAVLVIIASTLERRSAGHSLERLLDIRIFRSLVYSTLAMLVFDAFGWAFGGIPGKGARAALYAVNIAYFCIHPVPTLLYILYSDFQVYRDPGRLARLAKPLGAIELVLSALALSSPLTGLIFRIDENNVYVRGPGFPALAVVLFGLVGCSLIPLLRGRKKMNASVFWTLFIYPLPVTAAALAQDLHYGLVLIWPTTTLFLVTAAFNIQRRRASIDHLTGTANRRSLDEELERLVEGPGRQARRFGGVMLDLDEFKSINDRLGHEAGDRALEDAATILRASVRSEDLVSRYGGDEFVIILPNATEESLSEIVGRISRRTESLNSSRERPYRLAFSVGAGLFDPSADGSAGRFLARLDEAMYRDKAARKGAEAARS
jgi:diguanylate cyclase (GGDEF)-like protein